MKRLSWIDREGRVQEGVLLVGRAPPFNLGSVDGAISRKPGSTHGVLPRVWSTIHSSADSCPRKVSKHYKRDRGAGHGRHG